jgi:hypothetical protein
MRRRCFLGLAAALAATSAVSRETSMSRRCCPVVELRQYIMNPGRREDLIALFEREFVESQEVVGAHVIGTFRDLDRPDRFVWLRDFEDMTQRARALNAFYFGPVWQAHREAANAALLDNDDVLLLKPASMDAGFVLPASRAPAGSAGSGKGLVVANLWYLADADEAGFAARFEAEVAPILTAHGAAPVAWFVGEHSQNTFPRLPVREGERLLAWFAVFDGIDAHAAATARLDQSSDWRSAYAAASARFGKGPEIFRLQPTARSLLQG